MKTGAIVALSLVGVGGIVAIILLTKKKAVPAPVIVTTTTTTTDEVKHNGVLGFTSGLLNGLHVSLA